MLEMLIIQRFLRYYYSVKAKKILKNNPETCKNLDSIHINRKCVFTQNCYIGKNCHFNGMTINGTGTVHIGDNFHSGDMCLIITQNHNYEHGEALPYDNTYIVKDVHIGKNVWIGSRVIVLPGTTIGDGCVIQAGSVVHGNIPDLAICGGNPAMVIKYRDTNHYYNLERKNLYF